MHLNETTGNKLCDVQITSAKLPTHQIFPQKNNFVYILSSTVCRKNTFIIIIVQIPL